eukprot:scaffold1909_cov130-Cylindrotheca_fusiformis.AAC.7
MMVAMQVHSDDVFCFQSFERFKLQIIVARLPCASTLGNDKNRRKFNTLRLESTITTSCIA